MRNLTMLLFLLLPLGASAQTLGGLTWPKRPARIATPAPATPPPAPHPTTAPARGDSAVAEMARPAVDTESAVDSAPAPETPAGRPKWAEAFMTQVASDRISVTTSVVAIPLMCKKCVFRVMGNEVKTQVEAATPELREQLTQRISDLQSLIDNGGAYSAHFAREGRFGSDSGRFFGFMQTHAGLGKLDAPGDDPNSRFAGNVAVEFVGRADIGQRRETFEIVFGGRLSGITALSGSLLIDDGGKTMGMYQLFGLVRIYGTKALTVSWTGVPKYQKYAPRLMIGFNAVKP